MISNESLIQVYPKHNEAQKPPQGTVFCALFDDLTSFEVEMV